MLRGRYLFLQGLCLGILVWGAVSVGLRSIHYAWERPIPKVLLAPGRILAPLLKESDKQKWIASKKQTLPSIPVTQEESGAWESIKESVGFMANLMTIIMPLMSGIFSFALWRRQSRLPTMDNS